MPGKVTIDIEARFTDGVSGGTGKAEAAISSLERAVQRLDGALGRSRKFRVDVDESPILDRLQQVEAQAEKISEAAPAMAIDAVDNASATFAEVEARGQQLGGAVWTPALDAADHASDTLALVEGRGQELDGARWTALLEAADQASPTIDNALNQGQAFGGSTWAALLDADGNAIGQIENAITMGQELDGSDWEAVLDAEDNASEVINEAEAEGRRFNGSRWEGVLKAADKASATIERVLRAGRRISGAVWTATVRVVEAVTAPVRGIADMVSSPLLQAGAALGIGTGVSDMVSTYMDFQSVMSNVGAISSSSGRELDALTAKAEEMGAATKFTASEAGEAMSYMAMAGWKTQDMLSGIEGIMNLAAASGESLATTSDIVTDALTAFKLTAADSGHFADVLAAASSNANTNVSMMGETFKYVGTQAGTLGYSIEDVALATGLMANSGIKASMAGTSFSAVLTRLSTNTSGARDAIKELGVEFYDDSGKARRWRDVMEGLRKATAGMTTEQKAALAKTVAGQEAQKGFLAILEAQEEDYNKLARAIDHADGAAADMSRTMMDNLKGSMDLLKSATEGAEITIMKKVEPHLRGFIDWLAGKMPKIGNTVANVLDFVGTKLTGFREKIREITSYDSFQNADLGGKIKMLWKGLVADPLSEWWYGGGREKAMETAAGIGQELGGFLKNGLLGIFGLADLGNSEAGSAGASLARSFAEGFREGFDPSLMAGALKDTVGRLWDAAPGWSKALTAGIIGLRAAGGLSSAISFAGRASGVFGKINESASAGTGLWGLGSRVAIATGAGNLAGGGSLSAGALSALGLGEIAGGVALAAGGVHTVSSAYKSHQAYQNGDKIGGQAYSARAGYTGTGAVSGAAIGAMIGAAFGGIGAIPGALIGGGIGTVAGWLQGNKAAKSIEATRYETQEMRDAIKNANASAEELAYTFDKSVYSSMKSRFGDIELSLGEIQRLSEQMVWGDGKRNAYNTFADAVGASTANLQAFQAAASDTGKWLWKAKLGVEFNDAEKANIQASFDEYVNSAKDYVSNKHYEFTAAVGVLFDVNSQTAQDIIKSGDSYFSTVQEELSEKTIDVTNKVNVALTDGKIDPHELEDITKAQDEVEKVLKKLADAEFEAEIGLIKLKFGEGKMSLDSYNGFVNELGDTLGDRVNATEQAYLTASKGLIAQRNDGVITPEEYTRQSSAIESQYRKNINNLSMSAGNAALNPIAENYSDFLGKNTAAVKDRLRSAMQKSIDAGIDPVTWKSEEVSRFLGINSMGDDVANGFGKMLSSAAALLKSNGLKIVPDITIETDSSLKDKLQTSLDGIDKALEVDANVKTNWEVQSVGDPGEEILALVSPDGQIVIPIDAFAEAHWTVGGDEFNPELISPDGEIHIPISAIAEYIIESQGGVKESDLKQPDPVKQEIPVNATAKYDVDNSGFDESLLDPGGPFEQETDVSLTASYTKVNEFDESIVDPGGPFDAATDVNVTANYSAANRFAFSQSEFGVAESYPASTSVSIKASYKVNKFPGDKRKDFGINDSYSFSTSVSISATYSVNKFAGSRSDFGIADTYGPFSATVTVNVTPKVNMTQSISSAVSAKVGSNGYASTASLRTARGGMVGPRGLMGFAEGGMVRGGPQLVTVAEEGTPEMIIPLGPQRRQRGMQLWRKAGHILGAEGFANGGIAGRFGRMAEPSAFRGRVINFPDPAELRPREIRPPRAEPMPLPRRESRSAAAPAAGVTVNVGDVHVNLQIEVNGSDGEDVIASIEQNKGRIADMIIGQVRTRLEDMLTNTPALGGETA